MLTCSFYLSSELRPQQLDWYILLVARLGIIRASLVAQIVKNLPAMQETQVQSLGREDPLEKGMSTHSTILAWRIPWTEDLGRLQPREWKSVGHNWATNMLFMIRVNPLSVLQGHVLLTIACDILIYRGKHILIVAIFEHMYFFCV